MAYNPAMYQTYGNMYGNGYGQSYGQNNVIPFQQPQQSYQTQQQNPAGIIWVDGEVGAKAYQMPPGWPVNTPMPLWDTNDMVIYLKSTNQMGMPNPLQKITYKMHDMETQTSVNSMARLESGHGQREEPHIDTSRFVMKDELEAMKEELKDAINQIHQNQGGTEAKGARSNGKSTV